VELSDSSVDEKLSNAQLLEQKMKINQFVSEALKKTPINLMSGFEAAKNGTGKDHV
jgi:hypothetical protein